VSYSYSDFLEFLFFFTFCFILLGFCCVVACNTPSVQFLKDSNNISFYCMFLSLYSLVMARMMKNIRCARVKFFMNLTSRLIDILTCLYVLLFCFNLHDIL